MSPPFFLGAFTNSSSTTDAIIARARRNPPSPRRTSNLFRRQSAAKPLGFDPEGLSPSKYSFGSFLLPRPLVSFESRAARNDGPCLSRGIREQAAVCQGDYIPGPLLPNPPTNIKIPTYLRRAWHHHRFLRAVSSSFSTLSRSTPSPFSSSVSLPAVHSINGSEYATEHSAFRGFFQPPFSYTCARFSSLLNTRASFCFEWNATVQWSGLQLRVDYEIHSPELGLGLIV